MRVEKAVVEVVLEACQPLGLEASLRALDGNRAQRQYEAVDPSNRLVAAELELRWNSALTRVAESQARLESEQDSLVSLDEDQRKCLLELGGDLNAVWNDPVAPVELKKRILRAVIHEIVVDVNHDAENLEMRIHWVGGVHTPLRVHKNKSGRNAHATDRNVIELVRELARAQPDSSIATTLNRLGYQTGPGNNWNENRVKKRRRVLRTAVSFARDPTAVRRTGRMICPWWKR